MTWACGRGRRDAVLALLRAQPLGQVDTASLAALVNLAGSVQRALEDAEDGGGTRALASLFVSGEELCMVVAEVVSLAHQAATAKRRRVAASMFEVAACLLHAAATMRHGGSELDGRVWVHRARMVAMLQAYEFRHPAAQRGPDEQGEAGATTERA